MKNIKKLFALVLVALFGLTTNVEATSKWNVKRESIEETTTEIKPNFIKETDTIIYTIPEDYDGKKIYINISEDVRVITEGKYVPGNSRPFTIKVVNNSKYTYNYIKNSFKVLTDDLSKLGASDNYYKYDVNGVKSGIYVKNTLSYDGQLIAANWSIYRTQNDAIKKLFENSEKTVREKVSNNWKNVYYYADGTTCPFGTSWTSNLCKKMLTDEVLGAELVAQGYEKGIEDLNKYYLDHYNKVFNTSATKLEDLPDAAIYGYSDRLKEYLGGILNGNNESNRETNAEVSELGYNWFYNKGLGLYPVTDVNGNPVNSKNTRDNGFYVGNYMRNESTVTEEVVTKDLGTIESGSENSLTPIEMYLDFYYVTNAFSNMEFGFNIKFELARETLFGKLIVNYVDDQGNKLADSIITEAEVDTPYETIKKESDGYEFLTVEGETKGNYINGTIEVTYVYTNAIGDIDIPDEDPIEPPHTDAEVTTSNIIMYFEEDKKRK